VNPMLNPSIDYLESNLDSYSEIITEPSLYKIINIVALGTLTFENEIKLDFSKYEGKFEFRTLNRFPGILIKIGTISIILFKNGKMVLTGIKKITDIPIIKLEIEAFLNQNQIIYSDFSIQIQNFVSLTNLNRKINLEIVCLTLENCIYEPEQFPAAIIKPETGGTFLVFSNSKIIGLGMRDIEMLEKSLNYLLQDLNQTGVFFN
jgi:transcription initiation factor TFIID TATA-box-binding protein